MQQHASWNLEEFLEGSFLAIMVVSLWHALPILPAFKRKQDLKQ